MTYQQAYGVANKVSLNDIYNQALQQGDYVESPVTGPAIAWGKQEWIDGKLVLYVTPTDGRDGTNGTRAWWLPVRAVTYFERRNG